jgi:hypothetical protein
VAERQVLDLPADESGDVAARRLQRKIGVATLVIGAEHGARAQPGQRDAGLAVAPRAGRSGVRRRPAAATLAGEPQVGPPPGRSVEPRPLVGEGPARTLAKALVAGRREQVDQRPPDARRAVRKSAQVVRIR